MALPDRRRLLVDAGAVALAAIVAALLGFTGMWTLFRIATVEPTARVSLAFALAGCCALVAKARAPRVVVTLALGLWVIDVLLTGGGLGSLLVLLDALWTVSYFGSPRHRRQMLGVVVAITLAIGGAAMAAGSAPVTALTVMMGVGALFGTSLWAATSVAQAREVAELQRRARLSDAAEATRERAAVLQEERDAMARELHDVIAGHVSAAALRAEAALLSPNTPDADRDALRDVRESSLRAHEALRSTIMVLRGGTGDVRSPDALADLPRIIADAERSGIQARSHIELSEPLPLAIDQTCAHVIRESLANAARHGDGGEVDVRMTEADGHVRIDVWSSGTSDGRLEGSGWGLALTRERVSALGGSFTAGPDRGGWRVTATLPVARQATESRS